MQMVQMPFLDSLQSNRHWTTTITLRLTTQRDYAIYSILIVVCSHLGMYLECMFFISTASKSSSAAGLRCLSTGLENNSIRWIECDDLKSWTCNNKWNTKGIGVLLLRHARSILYLLKVQHKNQLGHKNNTNRLRILGYQSFMCVYKFNSKKVKKKTLKLILIIIILAKIKRKSKISKTKRRKNKTFWTKI